MHSKLKCVLFVTNLYLLLHEKDHFAALHQRWAKQMCWSLFKNILRIALNYVENCKNWCWFTFIPVLARLRTDVWHSTNLFLCNWWKHNVRTKCKVCIYGSGARITWLLIVSHVVSRRTPMCKQRCFTSLVPNYLYFLLSDSLFCLDAWASTSVLY